MFLPPIAVHSAVIGAGLLPAVCRRAGAGTRCQASLSEAEAFSGANWPPGHCSGPPATRKLPWALGFERLWVFLFLITAGVPFGGQAGRRRVAPGRPGPRSGGASTGRVTVLSLVARGWGVGHGDDGRGDAGGGVPRGGVRERGRGLDLRGRCRSRSSMFGAFRSRWSQPGSSRARGGSRSGPPRGRPGRRTGPWAGPRARRGGPSLAGTAARAASAGDPAGHLDGGCGPGRDPPGRGRGASGSIGPVPGPAGAARLGLPQRGLRPVPSPFVERRSSGAGYSS